MKRFIEPKLLTLPIPPGATLLGFSQNPNYNHATQGIVLTLDTGETVWTVDGKNFRPLPEGWEDKLKGQNRPLISAQEDPNAFHVLIRKRRADKHISLRRLGDLSGVPYKIIIDYELGKVELEPEDIAALIKALGGRITWDDEQSPPPENPPT
jgi:hypothetical protein